MRDWRVLMDEGLIKEESNSVSQGRISKRKLFIMIGWEQGQDIEYIEFSSSDLLR